jgi:hypothetical protein
MLVAHIFTGNFFTKYHQLKLNSQQPFSSFYFKSPFSSPENPQDAFPLVVPLASVVVTQILVLHE